MNNYVLLDTTQLPDINGTGYIYQHKKSKATIIIIKNDDPNKVFSACFPTPVSNNKGIPHIIEHSVLCGSKKYPLKDPFVELMKGSMYTFLNAMTYDDMTLFPIASMNDKDFKNLMDIYLDAIFHPNVLDEEKIFMQEGWHYEISEDTLKYNGVVFNEMKGYMANPDYLLEYYIKHALYPDSCLAYHSGGRPDAIVNLTYDEFKNFYYKNYHPSKCLLYLYGNIDIEERLDDLDQSYLSEYEFLNSRAHPAHSYNYDYHPAQQSNNYYYSKDPYAYYAYSMIYSYSHSLLDLMALEIIDYILVDSQGSLIKKQCLEENIGQDIFSSISVNTNAPSYSIICKNASLKDRNRFFKIVHYHLDHLTLDEKQVRAALHNLQFQYREQEMSSPKGLYYNQQILLKWLYHEEGIFDFLKIEEALGELERIINEGEFLDYAKQLLSGPHCSISLLPDDKEDLSEQIELKNKYNAMSDEEKQSIIMTQKELNDYQDSEEAEEYQDCIPILSKEDLPTTVQKSINEEREIDGVKLIYHNCHTHGIGYLKMVFDLRSIDPDLLPYVSLISIILSMVDTKTYSYLELDDEIFMKTGGIGFSTNTYEVYTRNTTKACFQIHAKFLYKEIDDVVEIIKDIIMGSKFNNEKRLKEILVQEKSVLESQFSYSAHSIAYHHSRKNHCLSDYYLDKMDYLTYYHTICDLLDDFDIEKLDTLFNHLTRQIFNKHNLIISYCGEAESLEKSESSLRSFIDCLYTDEPGEKIIPQLSQEYIKEAYTIPSQVNYVAISGYKASGVENIAAYQVLQHMLKCDYLWHHIRVKGGAYGCFAVDNNHKMLSLISYRDPHIKESLNTYNNVTDYVENLNLNERTLQQYIIGTINERENALSPHQVGVLSFNRYMMEVDEDYLNKIRIDTINTSLEDLKNLADVLKEMLSHSSYVVIGNENQLNQHKHLFNSIKPLIKGES